MEIQEIIDAIDDIKTMVSDLTQVPEEARGEMGEKLKDIQDELDNWIDDYGNEESEDFEDDEFDN